MVNYRFELYLCVRYRRVPTRAILAKTSTSRRSAEVRNWMSSTVAAILTVVALTGWHLRTRRHPCWSASADGRFYIVAGYPAVALAVFWLVGAATTTGWEWAIGNAWALAAMVSFVYGFNALRRAASSSRTRRDPSNRLSPMSMKPGRHGVRDPTAAPRLTCDSYFSSARDITTRWIWLVPS